MNNYKNLNVYQKAYKLAVDVHNYVYIKERHLSADEISQLKSLSRSVIGHIAEVVTQRAQKAKRYFNYKAMDCTRNIMMDLDFLHENKKFEDNAYNKFYLAYEEVYKDLYAKNKEILETA